MPMWKRNRRYLAISRREFLRLAAAASLAPCAPPVRRSVLPVYVEAAPARRYPGPVRKEADTAMKRPARWAG